MVNFLTIRVVTHVLSNYTLGLIRVSMAMWPLCVWNNMVEEGPNLR